MSNSQDWWNHGQPAVVVGAKTAGKVLIFDADGNIVVSAFDAGAGGAVEDETITEAKLLLSDNLTADVSIDKHGFAPKAPDDDTLFLRGDATWAELPGVTIPDESIAEAKLLIADNATADVSTAAHGFAPKAPNDTSKFLRGDGAWAAPAGGGGGLVLVETKIFTANATTFSFTGLDGDVDGFYRLIGHIKANSQARFFLRPNGATTNLTRSGWRVLSSGNFAGDSANDWQLHAADVQSGGILSFVVDIQAKKAINSVAVRRSYLCNFLQSYFSGGENDAGFMAGIWNETSTNLTSIEFVSTAADAIADGSQVSLYKYEQ